MDRLNRIWWCSTISFTRKFKLYKSLVTSILLLGCETWLVKLVLRAQSLVADSEKRIQVFESKCLRTLLCISYLDHKTSNWVWSKSNSLVGPQELLLATVKKWKLAWFGHVTRHSFSKTILQGILEGGQHRDQQSKWTTSKSGHPCQCQNCSQQRPAEKTGRGSLLKCRSCPPGNPTRQWTDLNGVPYCLYLS